MPPAAGRPFLDRPLARGLALLVFVACAGALAWIHRDDLFPAERRAAAADGPFARCFAGRRGDIDDMLAQGLIDEGRAALFLSRAEAMCRAETGGGGAPPAPPPLPQQ
jgi:hypothetical protein